MRENKLARFTFKSHSKLFKFLLFELITPDLMYHSGALVFAFIMTLLPLALLFGSVLSFIPNSKLAYVLTDLENIFPGVTRKVLHELTSVSLHRNQLSVLTLIATSIFAINFTRNFERALKYITLSQELPIKHDDSLLDWRYWLYFFTLSGIFVLTLSMGIFLDLLPAKFRNLLLKGSEVSDDIIQVIILTANLTAVYKLLMPIKTRLIKLIEISFLISLVIVILKYGFNLYSAHWLKTVPIYGSLAYLLLLLIWLNIMFSLVLIGARLIKHSS